MCCHPPRIKTTQFFFSPKPLRPSMLQDPMVGRQSPIIVPLELPKLSAGSRAHQAALAERPWLLTWIEDDRLQAKAEDMSCRGCLMGTWLDRCIFGMALEAQHQVQTICATSTNRLRENPSFLKEEACVGMRVLHRCLEHNINPNTRMSKQAAPT